MPIDLSSLNPEQRRAAECVSGPLLVLAGAGSGKTRVLTYRIAHLVADCGVSPWQILAITFTNKAAGEMRERLGQLMGSAARGMWICTFHAMCVRMLREDARFVGFEPNFAIYDDDDSKRLVRQIMDDLRIDSKAYPINMVRSRISSAKNQLVSAADFEGLASNPPMQAVARVYSELQRRLRRANAMDFDDLLVYTHQLLSKNPEVLAGYQERFRHISVDEYQDTNHVQYEITNLLAKRYRNLMVVGDDDQSIYSWRGADIQNILDFEEDYPDACVVRLEQNYRSTAHILEAANSVVSRNSRRKAKRLFTEEGTGELIHVYQASDERDEGRWVGSEIEKLHAGGTPYEHMAVFYRVNAQSRVLEDMFLRAGVPYRIVGGTRFFDRAEVRDVMAYLKLVVNPDDDVSALRVVNTPRRGVGSTSVARIQKYAADHAISFFSAAQACIGEPDLIPAKARDGLAAFCGAIEAGRHISGELANVVEAIVDKAGLITALEAEHTIEADGRIENIREFITVAAEFDEDHADAVPALESMAELRQAGIVDGGGQPAAAPEQAAPEEGIASSQLPAFMEWLALRTDLDSLSGETSAITMMTIHSAKGLEFPVVFVTGMEEGLFPHTSHGDDPAGVEEERRLAYVAITRAERKLYLTHALTRRTYGSSQANPVSRFLREIPEEHIETVGIGSQGFSGTGWEKRGDRRGTFGSGQGSSMYGGHVFGSATRSSNLGKEKRPAPITKNPALEAVDYAKGDRISHKTFGPGVVLSVDGDALEIKFTRTGKTKKLMKGFAPIVKVEG